MCDYQAHVSNRIILLKDFFDCGRLFEWFINMAKLIRCVFLVLFVNVIHAKIHIPLKRQKSAVHLMFEKNLSDKQMDFFKPKPPRGNDSIALYKYRNSEYYAIVRVGHPGQDLKFVLDTSWDDSWVLSAFCSVTLYPPCGLHKKYDSRISSTYQENGTEYSISVDNMKLEGYYSIDNFNIGHITVKNHTFAEITKVPLSFTFSQADGVLGFARQNDANMYPFFYKMYQQGLIDTPVFSFYVNRDETTPHAGSIFLGGYDKKHFDESTLFYMPVKGSGYWQFDLQRLAINVTEENKLYIYCDQCTAALDTSSPIITGPEKEIIKINRLLGAVRTHADRYILPCNIIDKLPPFLITIKDHTFKLHGRELTQKITTDEKTVCLTIFTNGTDTWFLGGAFMQRAYVIFNVGRNQLGFADIP